MNAMARVVICTAMATVLAWAGSLLQSAPPKALSLANPLAGNETARRAGAKLFRKECAACHGLNGEGFEKAPPLRRADIAEAPPGALFWVIENGSLYHGMPSFAHLPEPQRWQIVTFLEELNRK